MNVYYKMVSKVCIYAYKIFNRGLSKSFSILIKGAFAQYGKNSVINLPLRISGESRIEIGDNVFIGANSWLQSLPDGGNKTIAIRIGNGVSIVGGITISAFRKIAIENNVLIAKNVYISDHMHKYDNLYQPIKSQGVTNISPVVIRSGAWIGQNAVVCPGVTIGIGAVIGANSVVTEDVPDFSLAAGAPARVVKKFSRSTDVIAKAT